MAHVRVQSCYVDVVSVCQVQKVFVGTSLKLVLGEALTQSVLHFSAPLLQLI